MKTIKSKLHEILSPVVCVFVIFGALIGCQEGDFAGSSSKKTKTAPKGSNNDQKTTATTGGGSTGGDDAIVFDEGNDCFHTTPKLQFMFAIDKTASMDKSIATVIDNVSTFAAKVGSLSPVGSTKSFAGSKFGAVSYLDREADNMYVDFTADPTEFSKQLKTHNTDRGTGDDSCEGGLQAARIGIERLGSNIGDTQGIVPILIVISDNWSHIGTGTSILRSTDDSSVIAAIQGNALKPLMIIDAVPQTIIESDGSCLKGFLTPPSKQWTDIRNKAAAKLNRTNVTMGQPIGFTNGVFDTNSLLTRIPSMIQSSIKICK